MNPRSKYLVLDRKVTSDIFKLDVIITLVRSPSSKNAKVDPFVEFF